MKIIVASVPGAGKTTILNIVKEKLSGAKIVHAGDMFLELSKKKLKVEDRDELRKKLTMEQQRKFQEIVAEKISKMKGKIILIDTHVSIKIPEGYFPALSEKAVKKLKPDLIVVLEFNPEEIIRRRMNDPSRNRDLESEKEIEEHQKVNQEFAVAAASHLEIPVEVLDYYEKESRPFEQAYKAADAIIKLIKNFK